VRAELRSAPVQADTVAVQKTIAREYKTALAALTAEGNAAVPEK